MPMMDPELEMAHVIEERRLHFEQFVQQQRTKGNKGTDKPSAIHCIGHRDSYGDVVFAPGMHKGMWIIPNDKNGKVLIYTNESEAQNYAKSLLPILKLNGYMYSKVWVQPVAVRITMGNAYSALIEPKVMYEDTNRFIIRIRVA